ncbi:biotin--[acetyl-CoA-carboxylase] ligase [Tepidimicrobium xylanilyticum]|uniref:biotin--[acetyl-CoA-carboxylase] ligase n=1 Tax=Tepidimicrobium xylanilyticum TaxID=1123352 RepID=UPI002651C11E|nr:biotin--[acetyl-CoA-carboxylase] ligase [Tepidimicrobium xylanilyticum]GMG97438.1 bifunctional ligase/repressor BirA [Tepidimicrobium xylanilyticum]
MKKSILSALKRKSDLFVSGESISNELGISRTAVWKHIKALREEGYDIESVHKKGYRLLSCPDILTLEEIEEYLTTDFIGRNVYYFDSLSSTNNKAKEMALKEKEGTIIIAEEQIKGRGRLGRNWVSPKGKGIWMSIILKPDMIPSEVAKLTLIGAAAINRGLEATGINSYIKWPNDILIEDKKVCGILTEMSCELNMINYVIMGIGINVNLDKEDFNEELKDKATSLKLVTGKKIDRKRLIGNILNHLENLYIPFKERGDISKTIRISREKSILIGKEIRVITGDKELIGKALSIDDEGQLVVEFKDGRVEKVFSGEVSIRGLKGYI